MENEELERLRAENKRLRDKLDEEEQYREYVQTHRLKGYVAGYLSRCSADYIVEHRATEIAEKTVIGLRKLANNPAFSAEAVTILDRATYFVRRYQELSKQYYSLLETDKHLRQINFKKMIAKKKAGQ